MPVKICGHSVVPSWDSDSLQVPSRTQPLLCLLHILYFQATLGGKEALQSGCQGNKPLFSDDSKLEEVDVLLLSDSIVIEQKISTMALSHFHCYSKDSSEASPCQV